MTKEKILKLEKINKIYKGKSETIHILDDLSVEIEQGELVSIIGKSGSGKSTLLNMIGILDKPDSGSIIYMGKDISKFSEKEKNYFRNSSLGFVFQFHYLLPEFTALENIMIPALLKNKNRAEVEKRAKELLENVELLERAEHKPNTLSGGEKQRVAIARAMMNSPKLILADEPTGNLDEDTSNHINQLLKKINREFGQTIVVVTHSAELASITDRKLLLKKGKLEEV
jgi:lipoprotein-releasing system ATP-binding protein